ncbi:hypothetical protein D3C72_2276170 [compost metagenome]
MQLNAFEQAQISLHRVKQSRTGEHHQTGDMEGFFHGQHTPCLSTEQDKQSVRWPWGTEQHLQEPDEKPVATDDGDR